MTGGQVPILDLGGHTFKLTKNAPGGLALKIAEAEASGDVGRAMALVIRALKTVVADEDRERFSAFYESPEFDVLDIEQIAEAVMRAVAALADGRPTKSAPSSPGSSPRATASSRVVSLSPATSRGSSTGGRSRAS